MVRLRIDADGKYFKVYLNEHRVANLPNGNFTRTNQIHIDISDLNDKDLEMLIGNISVNAGGQTMYDALLADGRFATQGILFDTGSDRIRPESTPTLKESGEMLKAHSDLRILIEGHTDNVGNAASNQALSEKRAAAVKSFLEKEYKIKGDRLEAQGFGDTKPVGTNETPEGRQGNRRVELVKL
jgi:outer membrane protein OmpA-like peptidoglycan-associated protein